MNTLVKFLPVLAVVAAPALADTSVSVPRVSAPLGERITLEPSWELSGFAMPESVATASDHDWIYVSNVNADQPGFISRLTKSGQLDTLDWASVGGSPTGLALYDGVLYVGNFTQVDRIDVSTQTVLDPIVSDSATALNDVTVAPDGTIYVSDVVGSKVYALEGDTLTEVFSSPDIALPNGLLAQDGALYIGDTAGGLSPDFSPETYGSVYRVDLSNGSYTTVPTGVGLGAVDGVTSAQGILFASSNQTGELFAFSDRERVLLGTFKPGLADIGIFEDQLFAPFLFDNTVVGFDLKISD